LEYDSKEGLKQYDGLVLDPAEKARKESSVLDPYSVWSKAEPVNENVVKFSHFCDEFAFKIFLQKKRLPEGIDKKFTRPYATHPELYNTEYFPVIFSNTNGKKAIVDLADFHGRFQMSPYPEGVPMREWWDAQMADDPNFDNAEFNKRYKFQVSKQVYAVAPFLEIDNKDRTEFMDIEHDGLYLFKQLKEEILYHADIKEWCATLLALWTMGTHLYKVWSAYPYVFLLAERGSGKSRILKLLSMIASMGQYWVSPRTSPIFRSVESLQPTLLLDETEFLSKDEEQAELINLLNAGYERGAKVARVNKDKSMTVEYFDAYCPKAMASTEPPSPVLESRCLKIPLKRTSEGQTYVKRDPTSKQRYLATLQKDLCYWSIECGPSIARRSLDEIADKYSIEFDGAPPRVLQIMAPILSLYEQLGLEFEGEQDNLREILDFQSIEAKACSISDMGQRIISSLFEVISKKPGTKVTTGAIIEELQLDDEEKKFYTANKIGKVLKTLNVSSKLVDGRRQYLPDMTAIARFEVVEQIVRAYSVEVSGLSLAKENIKQSQLKGV